MIQIIYCVNAKIVRADTHFPDSCMFREDWSGADTFGQDGLAYARTFHSLMMVVGESGTRTVWINIL